MNRSSATTPAGFALLALAALAMLLAIAAAPAHAAGKGKLSIQSLSSDPDKVTGEDVLLAVSVPAMHDPKKVRVRVNGTDVTKKFSAGTDGGRLTGLVDGLDQGSNLVTAYAKGERKPARLALYDTAITGPLFSGPHQTPFICRTADNGLGAATDADCSAPTQTAYYYRTDTGDFAPLADPATLPANGVQTTTRDGRTVDYVVKVESGVIDRSIYRWAILAPGGRVADGWNQRLIFHFGGGCAAGYQQGQSDISQVLDNRELSQGYSTMSGSLNVLNTACNDVLSAEAALMLKEHVVEQLGRKPVWTIGEGSSGGSVQAQMIGQNYPGLFQGLLPSQSFPDNSASDYPDCRLINNYYGTPNGSSLTNVQREAIDGLANANGCAALSQGADVVRASEGCDESVVPVSQIFNPATNPTGIRCDVWDSMVNIYGKDPATGYARRTLDNVGVQYGLAALGSGAINIGQFLDLNEGVGGYDNNGDPRAARTVADAGALSIAYKTGRINQGAGGIPDIPIVDARTYVDDDANVHQYLNAYRMRARLDRTNGGHGNQVMFRGKGGMNTTPMNAAALDLIGRWMDAVAADTSDKTQAEKVLADKPSDGVDACWANGGTRTNGLAQIGDNNFCENLYPPHSLPANQAGKPLDSIVAKCQLKPLNFADYGSPSVAQQNRLRAIFPDGVCDWSKPGVGEEPLAGTWQEFGPSRDVKASKPKLGLKTKVKGEGRKTKIVLDAKLRPCPSTGFQSIVFEQRVGKNWRKIGMGVTGGKQCRAKVAVKPKGSKLKLRARFDSIETLKSARSKSIKVKLR